MFERIDLKQALGKDEYRSILPDLKLRLGLLQQQAREAGVPLVVVVEGWNVSGITTITQELILSLDPRGFDYYALRCPGEQETARPLLWRFWIRTPARGRIAIFDRSWYSRLIAEEIHPKGDETSWRRTLTAINNFERQLADDGCVVVKVYLHISKDEQKKRLNRLAKNPDKQRAIYKHFWLPHEEYDLWLPYIEEVIAASDTPAAPWSVIGAHDLHFAVVKTMEVVIGALERGITAANARQERLPLPAVPLQKSGDEVLVSSDLSLTLAEDEYHRRLKAAGHRIEELQYRLNAKGVPLILLFEGWDAAGKGGAIGRLTRHLNPRLYRVEPIGPPDQTEASHHWLWRFYRRLPPKGGIAIFDRTWYGRVLVERVEALTPEPEWQRAYREINEFEELLTGWGAVIVKFWLQIDREEQLRRFEEREQDPCKRWKITPDDWRNREKRDSYEIAVTEMINKTSTVCAPWVVVPSNDKYYSRVMTLETVVSAAEQALRSDRNHSELL